ncbi:serine/threonine-protein kinase [Calothrix sp. PCC 6303]|uniref:serine/threonine-protein kinase n=1 Tax=Calothrix sp. PCC 6303 TaxID=1170562 RepID=UPI0002A04F66|nr:serine/threonine-protein kinase [Calothrix sp. PCC 6303]AFZ04429.1 serine/threonine protein kinase [Calothrix sp. PCC 6303]
MLNQILKERYQIIHSIMQGGFGVTFLAEDTQCPGNPRCVVKKLQPRFDDEAQLKAAKRLFKQEAETLQNLGKHDQIPQLLAYFEDNQDFYLVQEYIEGHDLSQEIPPSATKLSEPEVIKLLTEIVEILAFVHENNVIHRDIKPSNIRRRKLDNKIVLIDFGAVKRITNLQVTQQGETTFTVAIGTPGYMPAEQAAGTPKLSSDIYAVGVICIQALTGIYFNNKGEMPRGEDGEISWRDHIKVSSDFADILDKMVRYDHRHRYVNATELMSAIELLKEGEKSPSHGKIQKKILIGLTGLVAAFGLAGFWYKSNTQVASVTTNYQIQLAASPYKEMGISFKYPEGWKRQDSNSAFGNWVSFVSKKESPNDDFQENITISLEDSNGTLKDSKNEIIKGIGIQNLIEDSTTGLGNKEAYQIVYTTKNANKTLKHLKILTLNKSKAYIITYTAKIEDYDRFLKIVEAAIDSFEFQ